MDLQADLFKVQCLVENALFANLNILDAKRTHLLHFIYIKGVPGVSPHDSSKKQMSIITT